MTMQLDTIVERVDVETDTYDAIGIDRANGNLFLVHGRHDRPGVPASIPIHTPIDSAKLPSWLSNDDARKVLDAAIDVVANQHWSDLPDEAQQLWRQIAHAMNKLNVFRDIARLYGDINVEIQAHRLAWRFSPDGGAFADALIIKLAQINHKARADQRVNHEVL